MTNVETIDFRHSELFRHLNFDIRIFRPAGYANWHSGEVESLVVCGFKSHLGH